MSFYIFPDKALVNRNIPKTKFYEHASISRVVKDAFVSQIQQMIQQGQLTRDTLVWTAGMPAWAAANSVQELSQLFGAVPPPL